MSFKPTSYVCHLLSVVYNSVLSVKSRETFLQRNGLSVIYIKGSNVRAAHPESVLHQPSEACVNGVLRGGVASVYNQALRDLAVYSGVVRNESYIALVLHLSQ